MKKYIVAFVLCCLCLDIAIAEEIFPKSDWTDKPDPLASPYATVGGEIILFGGQYPEKFNYYLDNSVMSAELFGLMYESLLNSDPITAEYVPGLANKWSISDDRKTFTFWIDPAAKWSDGKPVTPEDVIWTFKTIMDPKHITGVHKSILEIFEPPTIVDSNAVQFTAREVHWRNLGAAGGIQILPKHIFKDKDFNKVTFDFPVVSGPYQLDDVKELVYVKMKRRDDWWGRTRKSNQNVGNFDTLTFRYYAERVNAFEAFKKGLIDLYPIYTSRLWVKETTGERFDKNWIVKQRIQNYKPVGFQGFAMNMRHPPFDDLNVRKAMAHLIDREKMNSTLMYNQYFLHKSYYEDLYSKEHPCSNPEFEFNKEKARELLKEAGWEVNPETGKLEKDGQPFTFKVLTRDPTADKFLAIYGEDLKDVGISFEIDKKDWAAWAKDMDEFNYDMTWAAWGAGLRKDPEPMWSSSEAKRQAGNNITGFMDDDVDVLIAKQRSIFDLEQRHDICRQIDKKLTENVPYVLLWNINAVRLLYWNKFGMPPTILSKFGDERSAYWYWWYDEDSAADLEEARKNGEHLPPREAIVEFDEVYEGE